AGRGAVAGRARGVDAARPGLVRAHPRPAAGRLTMPAPARAEPGPAAPPGTLPEGLPADWPNRAASLAVEAGGLRWHVQRAGHGPVLLLLHGTGAATHTWRDLLPLLATDFTVVAPDLPG